MVDYDESARKYRWECYDCQAKFLDELKGKQVIVRKRGYGSDYVNLFIKHHKDKMRIGCSEDHDEEVAHARYEEKKLDEHRTRAGCTIQSPIVLSDEGDEDEDDTARLSELVALAEAGL
ncbi:uncharacterized protein [Miscanthus floridulus]|uniref:uncharacterized protein n=1 Tax=Miscanthus floridulus TaxID=154761 RepID=UPI003459698B